MKPKSSHWADQTATRLVAQLGDRDTYILASGITPSGTVHIGNFREVVTVDLVARGLQSLGKKVRFVYSWDDFDTFRKVPVNLPNQELLKGQLRKPINRVPDPYEKEESYARSNEVAFERELTAVGIQPEFIYQAQMYEKGAYAEQMRLCLEKTKEIKALLEVHRTSPLADDWLPTAIYCEQCERDELEYQRYDGEWNYSYKCSSCNHEATTDIRQTKNLKLNWRTDWPMRWAYEKVDFEPGGKDHSSQGGSYDTGKEIVKALWDRDAPIYLQYDFVAIKGLSGKMSSSKGILITLSEALQVYSPQMIRWIFANQRANHDFSIAFDEDVIRTFDEFDRSEQQAYSAPPAKPGKWQINRRIYELSSVEACDDLSGTAPRRAPFRELGNRLQVCDGDIERCYDRFYSKDYSDQEDKNAFFDRAKLAWNWLETHAPEEFKYRLNTDAVAIETSTEIINALSALKSLVLDTDLEKIDVKDLNQKIYDDVIRAKEVDAKDFFKAVYTKLINRDHGPRLPSFLKEVGSKRLGELL